MDSQKDYPFLYVNSGIFIGLLSGAVLIWFAVVTGAETLLYRGGIRLPSYLVPLVLLSGMVAGYVLIRRGLSRLYILRGRGRILEDRFELTLRYKTCRVPFSKVRRLFYKEGGRGRGIVVSAGTASLYLEEPPFPIADGAVDQQSLFYFYQRLEAAYYAQRK